MGMLVSCGNDASGDETEVQKKVRKTETAKQPNCKDIKGLNYNEIAFKGVSKDYLGFVYSCYGVGWQAPKRCGIIDPHDFIRSGDWTV